MGNSLPSLSELRTKIARDHGMSRDIEGHIPVITMTRAEATILLDIAEAALSVEKDFAPMDGYHCMKRLKAALAKIRT